MAAASTIEKFKSELSHELLLDLQHLSRVSDDIRIKKASGFILMMMNRSGAEATYNDKTNVIYLRPKNFVGNRVISISDFSQGNRYSFYPLADTIFHELAHADFDVHIENKLPDFNRFLKSEVMAWFRQNFRGVNSKIATNELFGYTAGDSILTLNFQMQDILLAHGMNFNTGKCFSERALKRIAEQRGLATKLEFKEVKENFDFYKKIVPTVVYVKGKVVDFSKKNFPENYKRRLYNYFVDQYNMPKTYSELIQNMNKSHYFDRLKACYKNILNP